SQLLSYQPDPKWFLKDPEGIHGIGHVSRVLVLQELIALVISKTTNIRLNRECLRWAAVTHDARRFNDRYEPQHAVDAAFWVQSPEGPNIPDGLRKYVAYLDYWHTAHDKTIPRFTNELKVLKDSDSLDRVRFMGLSTKFLRYPIVKELFVRPAEQLFLLSFGYKRIKNINDFEAVLIAAKELGILEDK
ncbi:MAG: hypothetical protein WCW14_03885, partial [Candidatus Paceibacterota bacterium]